MANEKIEKLVAKARVAQAEIADYSQEQVDKMISVLAHRLWDEKERLAGLAFEETGKGTLEFKTQKLVAAITSSYMYLRDRKSVGLIKVDEEKQLYTYAKPVGVLAVITPLTNPILTPIGNGLNALKARNAFIICPHPGAKKCTAAFVEFVQDVLESNGNPRDLVQFVPDGTTDDSMDLMKACDLIVATGGPGMVKAAYSSGTPALGVGQGNVQTILDTDYEDIEGFVQTIITPRFYDFGVACTGCQTVHVPVDKVDDVIKAYENNDCAFIGDPADVQKLRETFFIDGRLNRDIVGQPAAKVAAMAGIEVPENTKILITMVDSSGVGDVLTKEILCPVTRIYPYEKFEDAVERARANLLQEGAGHASSVFTHTQAHVELCGERIPVGRMMINQPSTNGSGRQINGFGNTNSIGCGYWGGTSVGHNVNFRDMMNYTVVSKIRDVGHVFTPEEIMADKF